MGGVTGGERRAYGGRREESVRREARVVERRVEAEWERDSKAMEARQVARVARRAVRPRRAKVMVAADFGYCTGVA